MEDIASREDVRTMNWSVQKSVLVKEAERIGFERFQVGYVDERGGHAVGDVISTTGDTANAGDRAFFKQAAADGVEAIRADARYDELAAVERKMIAGESGVDTYSFDGKEYFIGYSPILNGKWSFAITGEQEAALAGTYKLVIGLILLSLLFLVGGSVAIYVIGSRICNPIVRLTKNTALLADGNLKVDFDAKTLNNNNEVGDMARGLQQVQSNLRQIVAELQKLIRGIQSNSSDFSSAFDNIMKNVSDVNGLVQGIALSSNSQAGASLLWRRKSAICRSAPMMRRRESLLLSMS